MKQPYLVAGTLFVIVSFFMIDETPSAQEPSSSDELVELAAHVERLRSAMPDPPSYRYDIDSVSDGIAVVWTDITAGVAGTRDLRDRYDEFYAAALEFRANASLALINADRYIKSGNVSAAEGAIQDFSRSIKLMQRSNEGAHAAWEGSLEAAREIAVGMYEGSRASLVFAGMATRPILGPWVTSAVDGLFIATDALVESTEVGHSEALRNALNKILVKSLVETVTLEELGGRTISGFLDDATEATAQTFDVNTLLSKAATSDETRAYMLSLLTNSSAEGLEHLTEEKLRALVDEVLGHISAEPSLPIAQAGGDTDSSSPPDGETVEGQNESQITERTPGRITVEAALVVLGQSEDTKRLGLLRKLEPSLGKGLSPEEIATLAGQDNDRFYGAMINMVEGHMAGKISVQGALSILRTTTDLTRNSLLDRLLVRVQKPYTVDDALQLAGQQDRFYSTRLYNALKGVGSSVTVDDALKVLSGLGDRTRKNISRQLLPRLPHGLSPDEIVALAGGPKNTKYGENALIFIDRLRERISLAEYQRLCGGTSGMYRDRLEKELIPRIDSAL